MRCSVMVWMAGLIVIGAGADVQGQEKKRPNVVVIITDDQGYGDLSFHGNPSLKTPNLDRLAKQSVRMKQFYVSPVCSPTRASLLTGRYNYRTGVVDTFLGRSMMHADEVTLAEILGGLGYQCGIFGKWHLGDCYPMRPQDQGFHEVLVHRGGGIGQPSDPPGGSSYVDPVLQHNGKEEKKKGYVSDVFTAAAIDFMQKNRDGPFLVWLAFNAPHAPHQVPEKYAEPYRKLTNDQFPKTGFPLPAKTNANLAKVYGMIANIDDNVGKLLRQLDELKLAEDTIVIFLTDNGPAFPRYNAGMRGIKGSVHEGGTRVPFFVRWQGHLPEDRAIEQIAAHIDVTPTLVDLVGGKMPEGVDIDGKSLAPLWRGDKVDWPDRNLVFQWHRGDIPQLWRACAVRSQKYRLVQPEGVDKVMTFKPLGPPFQLYDIENDPYEQHDISAKMPEVVAEMTMAYVRWYRTLVGPRTVVQPRIVMGDDKATHVVLTKQDWRGPKAGWGAKDQGHWDLKAAEAGTYEVTVHTPEKAGVGVVHLRIDNRDPIVKRLDMASRKVVFEKVQLPEGNSRLESWLGDVGEAQSVDFVEVKRSDLPKGGRTER